MKVFNSIVGIVCLVISIFHYITEEKGNFSKANWWAILATLNLLMS